MSSQQVNPDLLKDRITATFNREVLTNILDGTADITERRRTVENLALQEEAFKDETDYHFMSRPEKYSNAMRKTMHYMKFIKEKDLDNPADSYWLRNIVWPNSSPPFGLHSGMFLPALRGQLTDEQKVKWMAKAEKMEIIGTYAQTEMGHGTYLKGLETTATYDPKTEEFVMHSPTLTSTKWWPGGLGKTCNHAVVMARLLTNGQDQGMHAFIVQLRSLDTHEPLPGITVGDIGPKFGYDTIDNGFLRFDHLRIPRDNMMMKNSEVLPDGTYRKRAKNEKMAYGTMVFVRAMIVHDVAARGLAQACTIAIRYSAVRRQSEMTPGAGEPQILDYQTQQYKLFPLLASAMAYWFSGLHMRDMYFETNFEIQQGNVEKLPELHALSAGLKAFTTSGAGWGIEQCRLACGGHGYSHASGLPKIYAVTTPGCTYEGENTVMFLQTARYLMKACQNGHREAPTGSAAYLARRGENHSQLAEDLRLEALIACYEHRAARLIRKAADRLQRLQTEGKDQSDAWNLNSVFLVKAAEAHCHCYVVKTFAERVENVEDPAVKRVLAQLCQLYAVFGISNHAADFIEDGYLTRDQQLMTKERLLGLLAELRPNAVTLVDAFDFTDHMLGSILGRFDGQVYDNLYKWALNSPLNKSQVHESYDKYLKPILTRKAKL